MKIIVTGGAGFIGSALIRNIISKTNFSVVNIDKLTYAGNLLSLKAVENSKRYIHERIDICDSNSIKNILDKYQPDVIMHLAAESHVDKSISGPRNFINTNIIGTYTLLESSLRYWSNLHKKKRSLFKFHHISTDEVYGDLGTTSKDSLFTEETRYDPSSPYAASKACSDHLVRSWARTYDFPTIITNCSNNYGPYQYPEKLIPLTILNALSNKTIPIYGEGKQIRDWLYVEDHAEALLHVMLNASLNETYNIGGRNEIRNIDVVKKICSILDTLKPSTKKYNSLIKHVEDRPGHDVRYAIDANKIKNELNWQPTTSFDKGIANTVLWYLENMDWLLSIKNSN